MERNDTNMKEKQTDAANKTKRSLPKIIAIVLIAAFVLFYIICQIYISFGKNSITTEVALADSVAKELSVDLFIVRDETVLTSGGANIVSAVRDGSRVSVNDTVAYSFADSRSAGNVIRMGEISELMDYYSGLVSQSSTVANNTQAYDNRIMDDLYALASAVSVGNFTSLDDLQSELRDAITSKQTATGVELDLSSIITSLQSEYASLKSATGGYSEIKAGESGYYISGTDGYETTLDYDRVDEWTIADVENAIASEPKATSSSDVGRVVHGYYWYLACVVQTNQINSLREGNRRTITFPDSAVEDLTAQVYAIHSDRESGKSLVIFRCNLMNEELATLRCTAANIVLESIDGYRIDNRALRANADNEMGVYVLSGSVMRFRKVNIVYSADDYSIVTNPYKDDLQKKKEYLNLYDEYIVTGQDLEDGKLIN